MNERRNSDGSGARGIGGAATSGCVRLRTIIAAGESPDGLRARLLGIDVHDEVSPLASAEGYRFQAAVLRDDALRLRTAAVAAGLAPLATCGPNSPGARFRYVEINPLAVDGLEATAAWLGGNAGIGGEPVGGVAVISEGHLNLQVGHATYAIRPDLLIGDLDSGEWRVGEIKSALDRGGLTSPLSVARACRQMAVGVVATRIALGGRATVANTGDLVLRARAPGGLSIHRLDLSGEVRAVERFLAEACSLTTERRPERIEDVLSIPCHLDVTCATTCGMFPVCMTANGAELEMALGRDAAVVERVGGLRSALDLCTAVESDSGQISGPVEDVEDMRAGFTQAMERIRGGGGDKADPCHPAARPASQDCGGTS